MKKTRFSLITTAILLLCLFLSSCGAAGAAEMDSVAPGKGDVYYEPEYGMATDNYYSKGEENFVGDKVTGAPTPEVPSVKDYSEKIIRDVNMSAETREFDRALAELRASVISCGGFEQSINTTGRSYHSNNTYRRTANMVLRIPAEQLDAFLNDVGDLVNVTSQSTGSTNVTTQYYDIQSRINVLESEKAAYEEMLKKSDEVEYLLKIKDRLYDVIEEIESYKTQLRIYDNQVAYSTVTVRLEEVVEYSPIVTPKDTFGTRVSKAFTESWRGFGNACQNFAIGFVYAIPTLLVLAVIVGGFAGVVVIGTRIIIKKIRQNIR